MKSGVTFELGTLSDRGVIQLSQAGLDVIRAMVIKWIRQAERGEDTANSFAEFGQNPFSVGQARYFRSAASYLTARLTSHLTTRINVRDELVTLTRWADGEPIPPRWEDSIREAEQTEGVYGADNAAHGGGGAGEPGGDIPTAVGGGQSGATAAPTADASPPPGDPTEGGKQDGAKSGRKRSKRAKADH